MRTMGSFEMTPKIETDGSLTFYYDVDSLGRQRRAYIQAPYAAAIARNLRDGVEYRFASPMQPIIKKTLAFIHVHAERIIQNFQNSNGGHEHANASGS